MKIRGGCVCNKAARRILLPKREEATDIKEGYVKKRVITSSHVFHNRVINRKMKWSGRVALRNAYKMSVGTGEGKN
jgi:hypothetical protein